MTETCIVLAGGRGTRLRDISGGANKHTCVIAGKMALEHVLDPVFSSPSVRKVTVVVQPHDRDWMREFLESIGRSDIPVRFQPEPNGTLAAVQCALPEVDTEVFSVHYGDNIFGWNRLPDATGFTEESAAELYALKDLSNFHQYGVIDAEEMESGLRAIALVEKPATLDGFRNPSILTGFFRFRTRAFLAAAEGVPLSPRGEFELTDAVRRLMDPPFRTTVRSAGEYWIDFGTPEKFYRAEEILRKRPGL